MLTAAETLLAATGSAVAFTFFLLAPYIGYEAVSVLIGRDRPQTSWVGIALAVTSLVVMPLLGRAKKRLSVRLGSAATSGEAAQNLLCAYLAVAVLVGLLGNTLWGRRWLDPVVALGIAVLAVLDCIKSWRGVAERRLVN